MQGPIKTTFTSSLYCHSITLPLATIGEIMGAKVLALIEYLPPNVSIILTGLSTQKVIAKAAGLITKPVDI
jgi:ATP:corrinoid adenosyltransferase